MQTNKWNLLIFLNLLKIVYTESASRMFIDLGFFFCFKYRFFMFQISIFFFFKIITKKDKLALK